jgi:amino acid adenylation domain-containing protein
VRYDYRKRHSPWPQWQNLKAEYSCPLPRHLTLSELSLSVIDERDEIQMRLEAASELFDQHTLERILVDFKSLLEQVVNAPHTVVGSLFVPSVPNLTTAPALRNRDGVEDSTLTDLFEEQAAQTPDNIAIRFAKEAISYQELNERSNRLAHSIIMRNLAAESRVGICIDRSIDMIVAILGVLKAGGCYVPLDPDYPVERLMVLVENADLRLLIGTDESLSRLPDFPRETFRMDELGSHVEAKNPPPRADPGNLAYVIDTSGSSGTPKPVMITHRGVVGHLRQLRSQLSLNGQDVVLQLPSLNFHPSVREIFGALTSGCTLVLLSQLEAKDPWAILDALNDYRVTVLLSAVPTLLSSLVQASKVRGDQIEIRLIVVCGETLSAATATATCRRFRSRIMNHFGPTETIMAATWHEFHEREVSYETVLAGKPMEDCQVYILDASLSPVPIGVPGEIYVSGLGLARGYLGRPGATAGRFVPCPFEDPGDRMYRTGDRGRYLPDGNIEFLGRFDNQVKIRGYRIEPGEIEAALLQHPLVENSVVLVRADALGEKRLVAYLECRQSPKPSVTDLRGFLVERLPGFMVPSSFLLLDEFPVTPNGKLDRRALPIPDGERPDLAEEYVSPRTHEEHVMATIWAEVLGVDRVGIFDNFFELGGHSLLAAQVISRVRDNLGVELTLRAAFDFPTVAELAEVVGGVQLRGDN